jgi:hypothetical protein
MRPYLKKIHHKEGLVEWLKVSSNPSTAKNKQNQFQHHYFLHEALTDLFSCWPFSMDSADLGTLWSPEQGSCLTCS